MNTQVQKIKDEIERRINQFKHAKKEAEYDANKLSLGARIAMCEELLVFINSLPEEPVIKKLVNIDYTTEQEIKKVYEQFENPEFLDYHSFAKIAHHFANWQKKADDERCH